MSEHPSFTRAKSLPLHMRGLFPTSLEEAEAWQRTVRVRALSSRVLAVAITRIECGWCVLCDAVPGMNHRDEIEPVINYGAKLDESVARVLFPEFRDVPYAH